MSFLKVFLASFEVWGLKIGWPSIIVVLLLLTALVFRGIFKIRARSHNSDSLSNPTKIKEATEVFDDGLNGEDISCGFAEGLTPSAIAEALSLIYRWKYVLVWNQTVPPVTEFEDGEFLYYVNCTYVKLHRQHEKFGFDILEFGVTYLKNSYCFFDYWRLKAVFEWYDTRGDWDISTAPPVPTYHALPSDRFCYRTTEQEWED